jgi:regulator of sigma E protease
VDWTIILAATGDATFVDQVLEWTWSIFSVAVGLGFVIFVHELGHFLVAKACGVKCEKFYIGFDFWNLRLCRFRWGETEYGIGIFPLGGYVKMLGQDDDPRQAAAELERCKVPADSPDAARAQALAEGTATESLTPGTAVEKPHYELDPRSYIAKPVWARMAIISAGVTMNVIFGALLAAWAYGLGVPEVPAIIGPTIPGTSAWKTDLEPGSRVVAFGDGATYEHYRFDDVRRNVVFSGEDRELTLTLRTPSGEERRVVVRPEVRDEKKSDFPTIGFQPPTEPRIVVSDGIAAHRRPKTDVPLKDRDRIIAMNGVQLAEGSVYDPRLDAILAQNPFGPLKLTVQRELEQKEKGTPPQLETLDVVVQPRPIREVGLSMRIGPVVAIRAGSPAEKAGFQVHDVILKVNGQEVGNPLSLSQRLVPQAGTETTYTFVVARQGADGNVVEQELTVRPEPPRQSIQDYPFGGPVAIESIGVAFAVTNEVAAVEEDSPADKAGLKPQDRVVAVRFVPAGEKQLEQEKEANGKQFTDEIQLNDHLQSWPLVHSQLQDILPDTSLVVRVQRGNQVIEKTLAPVDSKTFFDERRGLLLYVLRVEHRAESVGEAFYLGTREVKERMFEVVATITQLIKRPKLAKHLMGPAGIINAAGHFASEGLPTLLLFLTLLSANLAVLNFLPIPVLDGGHILFLTWEGITRRPVNPHVQGWLSLGGLAFLLGLMIWATAMDIDRFLS